MGFDLTFLKPDGRGNVPNRVWAGKVQDAFPAFSEVACDYEALARSCASDTGLSIAEYLARGIGIELQAPDSDGGWLLLGFWDFCVTLSMPNFPASLPEAISSTSQLRAFLRDAGFILVDEESGEPIEHSDEERAISTAYRRRQRLVSHVAFLATGRVPGGKPE